MIKCVFLDFGGVLYEINHAATIIELAKYSTNPKFIKEVNPRSAEKYIFDYESGRIELPEFRDAIRENFQLFCTDEQFDFAWNKILVAKFPWAYQAVAKIKEKYKVYLLSNTNAVHFAKFQPECEDVFSIMDGLLLSYKLGSVKPEKAIYESALKCVGLTAEECIFADDMQQNLDMAQQLGINTKLISSDFTVLDFANELV